MMTGPLLTDADLGPQDDDLNEEPTQIAGRMPSFLVSDEDPTSIGPRPGAVPETWFKSSKALEDLHRTPSRDAEAAPSRPSDSVLRALGGGREPSLPSAEVRKSASMAAIGGEASRSRQSLDLALPLGSGKPGIPAETRNLRSTEEQLSTAPGSAALLAGNPAALHPVASLDASMTLIGQPAIWTGPTAPSKAAAESAAARPEPPRPRPLLIGLTVVALGAAAFFVFKYFASQSTQTPAESTPTIAIAPAEPAAAAPSTATAPSPTAAGEEAAKPAPSAPTRGLAPSVAGSGSAATAPQGAAAAPAGTNKLPPSAALADGLGSDPGAKAATEAGGVPAGTTAAAATKDEKKDDVPPAAAASKSVASTEIAPVAAVTPRKPVKHKPTRAGSAHDVEAAPIVAAAASDKAASDAPRPRALADEPALPSDSAVTTGTTAPEGDTAAASGHQIRVTSKPPGADVAIDGQVVGQTPLATSIADVSAPHVLSVRKDGFEPFEQMIGSTSAWTRGKGAKGQATVPTLKINAKLKASGGGGGDAKTGTAGGDATPAKEAAPPEKGPEDHTEHTLTPASGAERAPVVP